MAELQVRHDDNVESNTCQRHGATTEPLSKYLDTSCVGTDEVCISRFHYFILFPVDPNSHSQRICKLQLDELQEECRKLNTRQTNKLDQIADIIANLGQFIKVRRTETADLVDLQSQMSQLSLTNIEISKGNLLLRSLMYERQNNRHMSIPTAHARTLKWVLTSTLR